MANGKAGLAVQDATIPNSEYQASSTNAHLYVMNDQRFLKKFRIIYGVRYEDFNQKLTAPKSAFDTIKLNNTKSDFLPSANLVYALNPKTNFRLSYSETVNRPEFRELAPFSFYEYVTGLAVFGDPTLQRSKINNYDFRYEVYPGKAQVFSVSLFYKNFTNPIEFVTIPRGADDATYLNNASAKVYGIETEFRFLLSTLFGTTSDNSLFNKFTISGNGAYIKSSVPQKLSGTFIDTIPVTRPLQGQSPYIANMALGYNDEKTGLSSTISYNRVGDRLAIAGNVDRPDYYEKQRTVIDLQVAKSFFNNKVELKFNFRDLLAQPIIVYLDFDKNRKLSEQDRKFTTNIAPRVFSFSASFKF
jgi:TonB-dependent receptor